MPARRLSPDERRPAQIVRGATGSRPRWPHNAEDALTINPSDPVAFDFTPDPGEGACAATTWLELVFSCARHDRHRYTSAGDGSSAYAQRQLTPPDQHR